MIRILSVLGTRPEAIKMAPVLRELETHSGRVVSRVCVTAQHRGLLDQVLTLFGIRPDDDLDLMRAGQSPSQVAAAVLAGLEVILGEFRPDWVLVQGDTITALAGSLAGFYGRARVAHVEAGLRSDDRARPFPEEMNRRLTSVLADLHLAPTARARANLLREGVPAEAIRVTGNPVIDALHSVARLPYDFASGPLASLPWEKRILLVTAHRRESFGRPLEVICSALQEIARRYESTAHLVLPVHPNPNVAALVRTQLGGVAGITLVPPLDYLSLVHLLRRAYLVLTDSGGLQEEAPSLGKPVLVLRSTTERPEAVEAGAARVVGCDRETIVGETARLLEDALVYQGMARAVSPFGDGRAAPRIVAALLGSEAGGDSP